MYRFIGLGAVSLLLLVGGNSNASAQCTYDNIGKKLTRKQLRKVKADAPLIKAIDAGDMAAFNSALARGVNVNARDCESGTTALILTIMNDNREMMKALIAMKANLDLQNNSGFTALMYAVGWGRMDVVRELINAGANVNKRTYDGDRVTALGIALRYDNPKMKEIADLLRSRGARK